MAVGAPAGGRLVGDGSRSVRAPKQREVAFREVLLGVAIVVAAFGAAIMVRAGTTTHATSRGRHVSPTGLVQETPVAVVPVAPIPPPPPLKLRQQRQHQARSLAPHQSGSPAVATGSVPPAAAPAVQDISSGASSSGVVAPSPPAGSFAGPGSTEVVGAATSPGGTGTGGGGGYAGSQYSGSANSGGGARGGTAPSGTSTGGGTGSSSSNGSSTVSNSSSSSSTNSSSVSQSNSGTVSGGG